MRTVVVGAGAAGLWCALQAAERGSVTVVAPGAVEMSATAWAQGGIAAVTEAGDSPALHAADTIAAGAGLCDPRAVDVLVHEAPMQVRDLRAMGMAFDESGRPGLEGGHSARRVLHANGDASGRALHRFLADRVSAHRGIDRVNGRVVGVATVEGAAIGAALDTGAHVPGDRIVLATGGACGIYGRRTGPDTSVGEGLVLAWDAGAALADVEFVQFHPTALDVPGRPARLLTEALRGEGAFLVDAHGERFMRRFHPDGDLASRDVVARAVIRVREETGRPVYLDATKVSDIAARFPTAAEQCREEGLDIATAPVPVAPAAHYFMGGILTDLWARTTVRGLFAAGESASTGVHGANRLASNSLAEALVFGRRAALADDGTPDVHAPADAAPADDPPVDALPLAAVRDLADRYLGVRRNGPELRTVRERLESGRGADGPATLVAWFVAGAASQRQESRGGHFRVDFPTSRPDWRARQAIDRRGRWRIDVPTKENVGSV